MPTKLVTCPKCGKSMREGYVIDSTHSGYTVATWMLGQPKRSFWMGLNFSGQTPAPIVTYRCTGCGYLENYVREAKAA